MGNISNKDVTYREIMFRDELEKIEEAIGLFSDFDADKCIERIHKDNMLNKKHSKVLRSFDEIKTLSKRLGSNIKAWTAQGRKVQRMPAFRETKAGRYPDEVQVEMKKADGLSKEVRVDFKALYLFSKILLDRYVKFLHFINPVDGIKSGTVVKFLNSLEESQEEFYNDLEKSLGDNADKVLNKLTFYRSNKIEHSKLLNEDVWFGNDMRGGVSISHVDRDGGGQVVTTHPKELLDIVGDFLYTTSSFFIRNKQSIQ